VMWNFFGREYHKWDGFQCLGQCENEFKFRFELGFNCENERRRVTIVVLVRWFYWWRKCDVWNWKLEMGEEKEV